MIRRMRKNVVLKVLTFVLTGPIGLAVWLCVDYALACKDCYLEYVGGLRDEKII